MALYEELINAAGGRHKPFSQIKYMKEAGIPKKFNDGVCRALATIYVARYGKGGMEHDPFEGKTFTALLREPGTAFLVQQLQQLENSRSDLYGKGMAASSSAVDEDSALKAITSVFKAVGPGAIFLENLKALGQKGVHLMSKPEGEGDEPPFMEVVDSMTSFSGRYLLKFPKHYVSAVCDHGRPKFKFFDPNFGQAIFDDKNRFQQFLFAFLTNSKVVASYNIKHIYLSAATL